MLFAPGDSSTPARLLPTVPSAVRQDYPAAVVEAFVFATAKYAHARALLERADIVHDHTMHHETGLPVIAVHTPHGPPATSWLERVRQISRDGHDHFFAVSRRQRGLWGEDGIAWAGVVHNGINVAAMRFAAEKEQYLLFIGRANWKKGLDLPVRVAVRAGMPLVMTVKMTEEHERVYFQSHSRRSLAACSRTAAFIARGE